jgi:AcrR family transcriptional regulator
VTDRRVSLLDAAYATFARYGYRKTSMDDVAREAEISRQALYGYFPDKEALFRDCMKHAADKAMAEVDAVLARDDLPIGERIVLAVDAYIGRHLDRIGTDGADLGEAGLALLGSFFADCGAIFEKKVARAIADSPLAAACKEAKATPLQLAETLCTCAKGWKHRASSRAEFVTQMQVAVRLLGPRPQESTSARKRGSG